MWRDHMISQGKKVKKGGGRGRSKILKGGGVTNTSTGFSEDREGG